MRYHANMSPRTLSTVVDPLKGYPDIRELMKWYTCWRKTPYLSEVVAALLVDDRPDGYSHYPCPIDSTHWHIGRGGGGRSFHQRIPQAKRTYRKAVRDEIWRDYVVRQQEEKARG